MKSLFVLLPLITLSFSFASLAQSAESSVVTSPSGETSPGGGLFIKISEAGVKKSLMAIPAFQFVGSPTIARNGVKIGKDLFDVFRNDMDVSGFFDFIKPEAFLEDANKVGLKPAPGEVGGFKHCYCSRE